MCANRKKNTTRALPPLSPSQIPAQLRHPPHDGRRRSRGQPSGGQGAQEEGGRRDSRAVADPDVAQDRGRHPDLRIRPDLGVAVAGFLRRGGGGRGRACGRKRKNKREENTLSISPTLPVPPRVTPWQMTTPGPTTAASPMTTPRGWTRRTPGAIFAAGCKSAPNTADARAWSASGNSTRSKRCDVENPRPSAAARASAGTEAMPLTKFRRSTTSV